MVFALALALAGLNPEEFGGLIATLTPDNKVSSEGERAASPSSRSESSGIGTLITSTRSSEGNSPWLTPFSSRTSSVRSTDENTPSSRPNTPTDEILKNQTETLTPLADEPKKRDVLNLAANLKDPNWQIAHPLLPHHDYQSYLTNQSVNQRLDEKPITEEYPMRCCNDCHFVEPSPYLFGDTFMPKKPSNNATTR